MFLSQEKRETRKKAKTRVKQGKKHFEQLRDQLQQIIKHRDEEIELYRQSTVEKWEYLQVSDKDTKVWGSLNQLGQKGWELVGISTFTEKSTNVLAGEVIGKIYTLYIFKRKILPEHIEAEKAIRKKYNDKTNQITNQMQAIKTHIEELERS